MGNFTIHDETTAPEAARERLAKAKAQGGFIPNLLGVLANAPTALEAYQTLSSINHRNSLTPEQREVVQITAASHNGCGFCVAGHSKVADKKLRLPKDEVSALQTVTTLPDRKLDALAKFTVAVMDARGKVADADLEKFLHAGYTKENALDVVLGVSLASLCNYTNRMARTPVNDELKDWVSPMLPAYA